MVGELLSRWGESAGCELRGGGETPERAASWGALTLWRWTVTVPRGGPQSLGLGPGGVNAPAVLASTSLGALALSR